MAPMITEAVRMQQVCMYLVGRLAELKERGMVETGFSLTPMGHTQYAILKASGFRPRAEEIERVAEVIGGIDGISVARLIAREDQL